MTHSRRSPNSIVTPKCVHRPYRVRRTRTIRQIVEIRRHSIEIHARRTESLWCIGRAADPFAIPRISVCVWMWLKWEQNNILTIDRFFLTIRSSSLIRSEFLLTNLNELATIGTSSRDSSEHFSANFVLELPMMFRFYFRSKLKRKIFEKIPLKTKNSKSVRQGEVNDFFPKKSHPIKLPKLNLLLYSWDI